MEESKRKGHTILSNAALKALHEGSWRTDTKYESAYQRFSARQTEMFNHLARLEGVGAEALRKMPRRSLRSRSLARLRGVARVLRTGWLRLLGRRLP